MATVELNEQNFEQNVQSGITFVDWWAPWCGPCRAFAPVYEAIAGRHPDVTWAKVNTEDEPALAGGFSIQAIPTLMIFRDGVLLFAQPGALPGSALEELLGKVRAIDMEDVKKRIAEASAEDDKAEGGAKAE